MTLRGKPVTVAYVLPNLERGGTERHVLDLASRLDRTRYRPFVITTAGGGPLQGELEARGVPVHILEYRGISVRPGLAGPLIRQAASFFAAFRRILRDRKADIVHAYLPTGNVLGMAAALGVKVRARIVSKRALCRYKDGHPVFSAFENLANLAADAIMVNSRAVAADVLRTERFADGKIFLVYNGIDAPAEPPPGEPAAPPPDLVVPPDAVLLTYVANIREDKAHLCLAEAAALIAGHCPAARFLFVGRDGGKAPAVRRRIEQLGLGDRVLLPGSRRDVAAVLRASTLVVHPGEQEGLSNAILEAMAAGIPVVAARAGGNPEVVLDGETGLLVEPGDPEGFARAVLDLLRAPDRRRTMGVAAWRRVREHFSMDGMVARMEATYAELLGGRSLTCRL